MKGNVSPLEIYVEHSASGETGIPERWIMRRKDWRHQKQRLVNSPQSGLAVTELSWKRQVIGNVAEEVAWTRQEWALNGGHCLDVFLWAIARNHSFLSNKVRQSKVVIDKPAK